MIRKLAALGVLALAVLALAAGLLWWSERPGPRVPFDPARLVPPRAAEAGSPPRVERVVLVTIDTLRADHLSTYGYPRETAPFLTQLAKSGVLFERAFASMPTTVPSHASLFTGLHPLQHGVRKNGYVLDRRFITLAELLRSRGWKTAAFVSLPGQFAPAQIEQGFDVWDQRPERTPIFILRSVARFGMARQQYRDGGDTVEKAVEWLSGRERDSRFFLWVHLFDPHRPYNRYNRFSEEDGPERRRVRDFLLGAQHFPLDYFDGDENRLLAQMNSYDGEVLAADRHVQTLFEAVLDGGFQDLLFFVTADHGEGLGNHHWFGHSKHLYNEQVRVPLVLYFSSGEFSGTRVASVVEHVDVFPSIAELAGVRPLQVLPLPGRSFLPLLGRGDGAGSAERFAFSSRREYGEESRHTSAGKGGLDYEEGEKFALQNTEFKYIHRSVGEDELYRLTDDPYETTNRIGQGIPAEELLREELLSLVEKIRVKREVRSVDRDTIKALEALGYVQ